MAETDDARQPFGDVIAALRDTQDLVNGSNPPGDVLVTVAALLGDVNERLRPWIAPESESPAGRRGDLPGRGQSLLLPLVVDERSGDHVRARVVFSRFYHGRNGAAHGGAVTLLFDEVLTRLSDAERRTGARTAYLHVNYRKVTPLGVELRLDATFDREEGRKRWLSARLFHGDDVVVDAEGLWIGLKAGAA